GRTGRRGEQGVRIAPAGNAAQWLCEAAIENSQLAKPVMLPPGCARLLTNPCSTGVAPELAASTDCHVLFRRDAKVLRRLGKDRALFIDRLGELRWPTRVRNLGSHDKSVVDERIGVHHGPDVRGDALA